MTNAAQTLNKLEDLKETFKVEEGSYKRETEKTIKVRKRKTK